MSADHFIAGKIADFILYIYIYYIHLKIRKKQGRHTYELIVRLYIFGKNALEIRYDNLFL